MACNASKTPFLRIVASRGYAAAAAAPKSKGIESIKTTRLANKIIVAAADSSLPISRVSIVFRAGSRNETYDSMGAAHMLRVCAGLSTKNSSAFAIIRHLQQEGIQLSSASDRELLYYTIEGTSDKIRCGLRYLQDMATEPAFKPWELSDVAPRLRHQVMAVPKDIRAVELLHRAAFRTGLGNSVNCPKYHIGKLSSETMQDFFCNTHTSDRCAVVGVGIDHSHLVGFAQNFEIDSGAGRSNASTYYGGGEIRKDRSSSSAHVAIAGEGASYADLNEALAFGILHQAYGAGSATKRGCINGPIGKAVEGAVNGSTFKLAAINASYTDSGLFGFVISTDARNAGKAVDAAVKALKSGTISADDIKRGKALLKAHTLLHHSSDNGVLISMARQASLLEKIECGDALADLIDKVSEKDVQAAARKVASSKLSMGAAGHLANVPYLSDLC